MNSLFLMTAPEECRRRRDFGRNFCTLVTELLTALRTGYGQSNTPFRETHLFPTSSKGS